VNGVNGAEIRRVTKYLGEHRLSVHRIRERNYREGEKERKGRKEKEGKKREKRGPCVMRRFRRVRHRGEIIRARVQAGSEKSRDD